MTAPADAAGLTDRTRIERGVAPRGPRRVSGPARSTAPAPAGAPAPSRQRRAPAPSRQRRAPAPSRQRRAPAPRTTPARHRSTPASLWPRLGRFVGELPDHRLLDRLIRGRLWIGIIAFALVGIVFMQVSLLKLNAGIGRSVQDATSLERQNAGLQAQVSQLSAGDRIEAEGRRLGMVMAPAGDVRFLSASPRDAGLAGRALRAAGVVPAPTAVSTAPSAASATGTTATTATAATMGTAATTGTASAMGTAATMGTAASPTGTAATAGNASATSAATAAGPGPAPTTTPTAATTPQTTAAPATTTTTIPRR